MPTVQADLKKTSEKALLILVIADKLAGVYKSHEHGCAIMPICVIYDALPVNLKQEKSHEFNMVIWVSRRSLLG